MAIPSRSRGIGPGERGAARMASAGPFKAYLTVVARSCGRHLGVPTMNGALLMMISLARIALRPEADGFGDGGCVDCRTSLQAGSLIATSRLSGFCGSHSHRPPNVLQQFIAFGFGVGLNCRPGMGIPSRSRGIGPGERSAARIAAFAPRSRHELLHPHERFGERFGS
jgi:hypothetical protein